MWMAPSFENTSYGRKITRKKDMQVVFFFFFGFSNSILGAAQENTAYMNTWQFFKVILILQVDVN